MVRYQTMRCYMNNYKTICIDLMETLIKRDDDSFYNKVNLILGENVPVYKIKDKIRQKYLEYSMGNYTNDIEYLEVVIMTLLGEEPSDITVQNIRSCMLEHYEAIDGSIEFLREIKKRGYKIIIASNFVDSWAEELIDNLGFRPYVDKAVISSSIHYRKPAKEFFDALIGESEHPKNEMLFIGNSFCNDYMGALKYGLGAYLLRKNNEVGKGMTYTEILSVI